MHYVYKNIAIKVVHMTLCHKVTGVLFFDSQCSSVFNRRPIYVISF